MATTTTTTVPEPTCSPDATPAALSCRIDALNQEILGRADVGKVQVPVARDLVRARTALSRAEDQLVAGSTRRAIGGLRKAVKALKTARRRLGSPAARKTVSETTRAELSGRIDALASDARGLVASVRAGR